jgi:hypothetical protein
MSEALDPAVRFAHQLGHLEGRLAALERKVDGFEQRVETRLASIETKLDQLGAALNFGRGGWKALAVIAAALAALLSLLKGAS